MEALTGRLITDEEQARWDADSKKRELEFNAECRKLGYNPNRKLFGFMLLNKLTDTDFQVKLSERYNLWERNFVGMPIEIKKLEINKAKHELQHCYNTVERSTDYPLYKKQKLEYLTTFIQKVEDAIHIGKLETMPTWAKETELECIWIEVLSLKWVDAKDKSNFFKAFGVFKDYEPFVKVRIGDSATKLMAFLTLMVDRADIQLSDKNKSIANNLFTIELNKKRNLKRDKNNDELERWSEKLPRTNKLRKPIVIIPQDAGGLSY